jgi:GNAT superfamily N-acetyltransferase
MAGDVARWGGGGPPEMDGAARALLGASWRVALVTGPSGAGKSTLLRRAIEVCGGEGGEEGRVVIAREPEDGGRRVIDLIPGEPLGPLSRAGLAEAGVLGRRVGALSTGQRARLGVALAMARASRVRGGALVVIDELGSGLDEITGAGVCAGIRRFAAASAGVRVLAAGCAGWLEERLGPDVVARVDATGRVEIGSGPGRAVSPRVSIEAGTMADYERLAAWHYRPGKPAVVRRVLRAVGEDGRLAGVLVTAMPTLNGAWRSAAWPGRFAGARGDSARRLGEEVRCLARVIVDPAWRSLGVGSGLVRAYLARPETVSTEALAAMGHACPMFERAGMRAVDAPPAPAEARLLDALAHEGLGGEALTSPGVIASRPLLERELRRWAASSRATRGVARRGVDELGLAAARRVLCRPRAYVFDDPG